jgi:hypothetical protein
LRRGSMGCDVNEGGGFLRREEEGARAGEAAVETLLIYSQGGVT